MGVAAGAIIRAIDVAGAAQQPLALLGGQLRQEAAIGDDLLEQFRGQADPFAERVGAGGFGEGVL